MAQLAIKAELRQESGKGAARKLRRQGKLPGVLYGSKVPSVNLSLDAQALQKLLQSAGASGLIELDLGGQKKVVLIKSVDEDPVSNRPLHVDFHAVDLDQEVQVAVPVVAVGEENRESDGGILSQAVREITVSCLPTAIPERIEVDVSQLKLGEAITVADIAFPEGVQPQAEADEAVFSIVLPQAAPATEDDGAQEEPAAEEGADGADQDGASED